MAQPAIRVESLTKTYRLGTSLGGYRTLRDSLAGWFRRERTMPAEEVRALDGVSFEVQPGEVVGVIGRNGAGKSTLLKILSRITEPSAGRAVVRGRLGALLEVGTGFHPELTGRENVFLSGAILGMRRAETHRRFDEIIEFAELSRFVDTPVKHYSSGMYMRLAFAVAAHLEPEILLVDEVLAVGDASFQRKCLGKMGEVGRHGRTVLFVSHNLAAVSSLCSRALLLKGGSLQAEGATATVVARYMADVGDAMGVDLAERQDRQGSQELRITGIELRDGRGRVLNQASSGGDILFVLRFATRLGSAPRNVHASLAVTGCFDERLFYLSTLVADPFEQVPADGAFVCRVPRLPLLPGRYHLSVLASVGDQLADWVQGAAALDVVSGNFFGFGRLPPERGGPVLVEHSWDIWTSESKPAERR